MPEQNSFRIGFEMINKYDAAREFESGLTDSQRADLRPEGYVYLYGSNVLSDATWDMANCGDPDALTLLGIAARADIPTYLREYEAVPGYHEAPAIPKPPRRQNQTVFDFEREMLALEEDRYNQLVKIPSLDALKAAKRAEKTPFDAA
jgi:hypothetical protein